MARMKCSRHNLQHRTGADPGISKRGRGGPGAVDFLDLRFALMPLHTYPMFLLEEVMNDIHIVNTAC